VRRYAGGNVTTPQFIALAERISGQDLDALFDEWLFTPARPASLGPGAAAARLATSASVAWVDRLRDSEWRRR
jgi:CubicO group peptidase (beta-lactamase class C family)